MDMKAPGTTHGRFDKAAPWIALLLPPLAWGTFEWGLIAGVRVSCAAAGSWFGITWGAIAMTLCAVAFAIGRSAARAAEDADAARPWLARIATAATAIFALAIAFQTLAILIVPSCAR